MQQVREQEEKDTQPIEAFYVEPLRQKKEPRAIPLPKSPEDQLLADLPALNPPAEDLVEVEGEVILPPEPITEPVPVDATDGEFVTLPDIPVVKALTAPEPEIEIEVEAPEPPIFSDEEDLDAYLKATGYTKRRRSLLLQIAFFVFLALSLAGGLALDWQHLPWGQPLTASITIFPASKMLTLPFSTSLSQVSARTLPSVSKTQSLTVATTGTGYTPATQATGSLVFFNPQPYPVTVPAGGVLTGGDGVRIALDESVVVPAGNPPVEGEISARAHAVNAGPSGNIAALDINGACCVSGMLVRNPAAFSGGQDRVPFQAVSEQDVNGAKATLKGTLDIAIQQAFQVSSTEQLLAPTCQENTQSSIPVGQTASQVTVTLTETCQAVAYNQEAMNTVVLQTLQQGSSAQYQLSETVSPQISATLAGDQIKGSVKGTMVYQWSTASLAQLARKLAGRTKAQAFSILKNTEGIGHFTLSLSDENSVLMPTGNNIQIAALG